MFRRKEEENDDPQMAFGNDNDNAATPTPTEAPVTDATKPSKPVAAATAPAAAAAAAPVKPAEPALRPAAPSPAANLRPAAPAPAPAAAATPARAASAAPSETRTPSPATKSASNRILTVGADINMNGEINSCDRLVIEGIVDATLKDVHTVELAETGSLRGTAEVQDAEISGHFEGDLVVSGRLIIYSSGSVRGNVTYGEIEIERGGQLSGSIGQGSAATNSTKKAA